MKSELELDPEDYTPDASFMLKMSAVSFFVICPFFNLLTQLMVM